MALWHETLDKAERLVDSGNLENFATAGDNLRKHLEEDLMISTELSSLSKELNAYSSTVNDMISLIAACRRQSRGLSPDEEISFHQRIAGLKIRANSVSRNLSSLVSLARDLE